MNDAQQAMMDHSMEDAKEVYRDQIAKEEEFDRQEDIYDNATPTDFEAVYHH